MSLNKLIITCSWYLTNYTLDLYLGDLWYNTLSFSLYLCYFVAYFQVFILFHYSIIVKANSGYINSDYSDVRCRVYIWGLPCLDYSIDILISRISNVGLYNWFFCSYLTVSFHAHMCLYSRYTFPVHVCLICTPLGFIICTRWVVSDNPASSCPDSRVWTMVALL